MTLLLKSNECACSTTDVDVILLKTVQDQSHFLKIRVGKKYSKAIPPPSRFQTAVKPLRYTQALLVLQHPSLSSILNSIYYIE